MQPNSFNTIIILLINFCMLLYALWLNRKLYKSYCYISLHFLFNLFFFFFYICTHTYIILSGNIQTYYKNIVDTSYISSAAIFVTFLNVFFNLGYTINLFFPKTKQGIIFNKYIKKINVDELFRIGLTLFIIGMVSKLIYFCVLGGGNILTYLTTYFAIQLERVSEHGGATFEIYLNFLFILLDVGTDLLLIYTLKTKQHKNITFLCMGLAVLLYFNTRFGIIKLLFQYIIIVCLYLKKIRERIPVLFLGIFIPIIFTIIVGLGIYRDITNNKVISNIDYGYFFMGQFHPMMAIADGMAFKNQFGGYRYGKAIILPIIQKPIPRSVWKNKELNAGAIYTKTMKPGDLERGFAVAPGIAFDAYLNFGYVGALIFFMLLGVLIFKVQSFLYRNIKQLKDNNTLYVILTAIFGSTLLTLRGADFSNIPLYIIYYIPILIIIFSNIKIRV